MNKQPQSGQTAGAGIDPIHSVAEYLEEVGIEYELINVSAVKHLYEVSKIKRIPLQNILRTTVVSDGMDDYLITLPINRILDYPNLCRALNKDFEFKAPTCSKAAAFYDEHLNSILPFGPLIGMKAIIDKSVFDLKEVYVVTGHNANLLKLSFKDFNRLQEDVLIKDFTYPMQMFLNQDQIQEKISQADIISLKDKFTPRRMKERVQETFELPIMPSMADELLKLRVNPAAGAMDLARLVEHDPSLAAQLVSWACSPYYGYPGKITSISDAIIKVLGYDLVMNIALGIAIGQVMKMTKKGPLGLENYWRHSLYTATLMEQMIRVMPPHKRPLRGLAYLCGLLHNFGFLLLGQVLPPQFYVLNQSVSLNPEAPLIEIENHLFGLNHQQLGSWLMTAWHMPEELVVAVLHHHNENFEEEFCEYAHLVLLANRLLAKKDVRDDIFEHLPAHLMKEYKLKEEDLLKILNDFWENKEGLDNIIKSLSN